MLGYAQVGLSGISEKLKTIFDGQILFSEMRLSTVHLNAVCVAHPSPVCFWDSVGHVRRHKSVLRNPTEHGAATHYDRRT